MPERDWIARILGKSALGTSPDDLTSGKVHPAVLAGIVAQQVRDERARLWQPLPGPQTQAYNSNVFELLFGGAAGGGKSDLLLGLARFKHKSVLLLRRTYPQLEDTLILRARDIFGDPRFFNSSKHVWEFPDGCRIRFGHLELEKDVYQYQSAQFDLIAFDELTQFTQFQYEYLLSRARTTLPGQKVRVVSCSNPGGEGNDWVVARWAPWLDPTHPNPAAPGEIRYFRRDESGREIETGSDDPDAMSRSFIPARLADNPYLGDDYRKTLNLLPEPLRSQLLHGDWAAGQVDDIHQLIPTAWIRMAMERWSPDGRQGPLSSIGVDVARGGQDKTVLAKRYGNWFAPLEKYPGSVTRTGQEVVMLIAPVLDSEGGRAMIDVIGVGSSAYDIAKGQGLAVHAVNWAEKAESTDRSGKLRFVNKRAEQAWRLREALDPDSDDLIALPNDPELLADLAALRWKMQASGIKIESKDEIRARIGRSPDAGDAVILALAEPVDKVVGCLTIPYIRRAKDILEM
ncbi:terminase family protein [candidate division KSB1 bacterium]|nr:terminase family protein [candidate division KSB1 bacterium]